jgi:hypothetical protein
MATLDDYRAREHWSFSALNQFLNICSLLCGAPHKSAYV